MINKLLDSYHTYTQRAYDKESGHVNECVYVCVCVRERERQRETEKEREKAI